MANKANLDGAKQQGRKGFEVQMRATSAFFLFSSENLATL
jgi:hypothetical protein